MAIGRTMRVADRLALTYEDAIHYTGFSREVLADAVVAGEITTLERGREVVLLREDLEKFLKNSKRLFKKAKP